MDKNPFPGHVSPSKQRFSSFGMHLNHLRACETIGNWASPSGILIHMSGEDLRIGLPNKVAGDIDAVGLGTTL